MKIFELSQGKTDLDSAIKYFWNCWGNEKNYAFYEDCIKHSLDERNSLPKFYIGLEDGEIIGSYALLVNDLISRQDLMPWFACLYVNEAHRNKGLAAQLLTHGLAQAASKGFAKLYLSTDLQNFYERKGWQKQTTAFNFLGEPITVYSKNTKP